MSAIPFVFHGRSGIGFSSRQVTLPDCGGNQFLARAKCQRNTLRKLTKTLCAVESECEYFRRSLSAKRLPKNDDNSAWPPYEGYSID